MYARYLKGKKVISFDLDGTLIDTDYKPAYRKVLTALGASDVDLDLLVGKGHGMYQIAERIIREENLSDKTSIKDFVNNVIKEFLNELLASEIKVREGFWQAAAYFKEDKGLKLAMVTNSERLAVDAILSKLGITEIFDLILTGSDVEKPKPHPQIYKEAATRLSVEPNEFLVFEDSPTGVISAHDAGMPVIVIWDGETDPKLYPDEVLMYIPDFTEIPNLFKYDVRGALNAAAQQPVS